jgi:uncharacterized protein (TIGR03663 family)
MSRRTFAVVLLCLTALACALRFPRLADRPMHADEAVHAAKFRTLWENGDYRYDPDEFHGPILYYATLASVSAAGRRTFPETLEADYRLVPALFGVGLILLLPLFADALGRPAVLAAAALFAVSPAFVFYSRYYIQEIPLVCCSLGALGCAWRYAVRRGILSSHVTVPRDGHNLIGSRSLTVSTYSRIVASLSDPGESFWAIAFGAFVGLMLASKETAILTLAAALGAAVLCGLATRPSARVRIRRRDMLAALTAALFVATLLLTDIFRHPAAAVDFLRSYAPWFRRGADAGRHQHSFWYYLQVLFWTRRSPESPIFSEALIAVLALGGVGSASIAPGAPIAPPSTGFRRFLAVTTALLFVEYSLIPYKTPWCALSFLAGLILLAGAGTATLLRAAATAPTRTLLTVVLAVGFGQLTWQAYRDGFVVFNDRRNPYVYAPTAPEAADLAARIVAIAGASPEGERLPVEVFSADGYYWPLPWYLRSMDHVGYWTGLPAIAPTAIVIASPEFDGALTRRLNATHLMTGYFSIRPGALLEVWVRLDDWQRYLRSRKPTPDAP